MFDDILIKASGKKKGDKYRVESTTSLREYTVIENPDPNTRSKLELSSSEAAPNISSTVYLPPGTFLLRSDGPSLLLHADTLVESDKWRIAIEKAINQVMRKLSTLKITPEARAGAVKDQIARQYTDPSMVAALSSPPTSPKSGLRSFAIAKQKQKQGSLGGNPPT